MSTMGASVPDSGPVVSDKNRLRTRLAANFRLPPCVACLAKKSGMIHPPRTSRAGINYWRNQWFGRYPCKLRVRRHKGPGGTVGRSTSDPRAASGGGGHAIVPELADPTPDFPGSRPIPTARLIGTEFTRGGQRVRMRG